MIVGALAAAGAVTIASAPTEAPAPAERGRVLADFSQRWETWRRLATRYTETVERVSGDRRLEQTADVVQRFPDRVIGDGDTVNGRIAGRRIGCVVTDSGPSCVDNGPVDAEAELAAELDEFERLTGGQQATYRLSDLGDSCYRFRHVVPEFRPRWGDRTDICFDDGTGVVTRETTRLGAVTTRTTRRVSDETVGDADFELPAVPVPSPARTTTTS